MNNKEKFHSKNRTPIFKKAIEEIEEVLREESTPGNISIEKKKITLKNVEISELLSTFIENETVLRTIFNQRRSDVDRFISGNGYDFLTVLYRTLTSSQQQALYCRICEYFMGDIKKYIRNPTVSQGEFSVCNTFSTFF